MTFSVGAEEKRRGAKAEDILNARGWRLRKGVWFHPDLTFPWPLADAMRLERERDEGSPSALRLLGEVKP